MFFIMCFTVKKIMMVFKEMRMNKLVSIDFVSLIGDDGEHSERERSDFKIE